MSDSERLFPIGILKKSRNRELKPDFEKGEFFLADYLNKNLPKEWNIYTRPELKARWGSNQNKKTPDVVIAHPSDGIMIFEVKNWNISNFFVFIKFGNIKILLLILFFFKLFLWKLLVRII